VQIFRCGYDAVTGWDGLRALVTELPPASKAGSSSSGGGQPPVINSRFWVDMPSPGAVVELQAQVIEDPGVLGYNAVLAQLYQAYAQRLPKAAKEELKSQGYLTPGRYSVSCPSDRLLEISWHWTANAVQHPLEKFLVRRKQDQSCTWRMVWPSWAREASCARAADQP
jgi:hypothetical protein